MPEPYDSADLDAIRELRRSRGWALVSERLQDAIEITRNELEMRGAEPQYPRGMIRGLRLALEIPGILADELKRQVASKE